MVAPGSLVTPPLFSPLSRAARRRASHPGCLPSSPMFPLYSPRGEGSRPCPFCLLFLSLVLPSHCQPFSRAKRGQLCLLSSVCTPLVVRAMKNCSPLLSLCALVSACL